jgi:hypothetical protein
VLKMVPLCLLWCLWREINDKSFEYQERTMEELKLYFSILCIFGQVLLFLL